MTGTKDTQRQEKKEDIAYGKIHEREHGGINANEYGEQ
jgi:hypothetical protein